MVNGPLTCVELNFDRGIKWQEEKKTMHAIFFCLLTSFVCSYMLASFPGLATSVSLGTRLAVCTVSLSVWLMLLFAPGKKINGKHIPSFLMKWS